MPPPPRTGGFPWNRQRDPFARTQDPADLQQLVDRTDWLQERNRALESRVGGLEYGTRALLARAAAVSLVVAQVVVLALPWFAIRAGDDDLRPLTAGPWTLVGSFSGSEDLDLSYLLVALVPMAVYVAALVATAGAAFAATSRVRVVAVVLDIVATLVAVAQVGLVSGAGEETTSVEVLAPGITAILLWVATSAVAGLMEA